jgi:hypothetical protein
VNTGRGSKKVMKEILEIRVDKKLVDQLNLWGCAEDLTSVCIIRLQPEDPVIKLIKEESLKSKKNGDGSLYYG